MLLIGILLHSLLNGFNHLHWFVYFWIIIHTQFKFFLYSWNRQYMWWSKWLNPLSNECRRILINNIVHYIMLVSWLVAWLKMSNIASYTVGNLYMIEDHTILSMITDVTWVCCISIVVLRDIWYKMKKNTSSVTIY